MNRMLRKRNHVLLGALVFSVSLAMVSGRVGGTFPGGVVARATIEKSGNTTSGSLMIPASSPLSSPAADNSRTVFILNVLGIGTAVLLAICVVMLVFVTWRYKLRRSEVFPANSWITGLSGQLLRPFEMSAPLLSREELEVACEDFSNIIGYSPDGVVYKGTLSNGTEVAVTSIRMRAADWSPASELSFRRKVEALARMKHKHLVNLLGYCTEESPFTRMLVFEYASNGTLADHLHNPKEAEHLDWPTRMRIVMGAACGLEYMHHDLTPPCSHLSFDSNAVYLTDDYAAKLANFGIARMLSATISKGGGGSADHGRMQKQSSWAGGNGGGHSDEWEGNDRHCPGFESNMYNFGVFLLETVSGRPSYCEPGGNLVDWAAEFLNDPKQARHLVDPSLKSHNADELLALCKIVNICLSNKGYKRPSMRKVSQMLADGLKMTPDAASCKVSPLLWAQLEILDDS